MKKIIMLVAIILLLSGCNSDNMIELHITEEGNSISKETVDINVIKDVSEFSNQLLEIMYNNYSEDIIEYNIDSFGTDDIVEFYRYVNYKNTEISIVKHYSVLYLAENEREEYYLKLIIKKVILKELYDIDIAHIFENNIDMLVDEAILLYNNEVYDNEIVFIINKLAKEKELSFEKYAKTIYKSYLEFTYVERLYPDEFVEEKLNIDIIEPVNMNDIQNVRTEDWNNAKEYFERQIEIIDACEVYLEEMYQEARK